MLTYIYIYIYIYVHTHTHVCVCVYFILYSTILHFFLPLWRCGPTQSMASSFLRFLDHTQWHTTVSKTPLDAWSARRRDLYLITRNTHNRETSMPPVGFEPIIPAGKRSYTCALDRTATGTGQRVSLLHINIEITSPLLLEWVKILLL